MPDRVRFQLRLRPPRTGVVTGLVRRPRLEQQLAKGVAGPVTLVTGGPGAGKTSAVASWVSSGAVPMALAWLTMDSRDNDLATVWSDMLAALVLSGAVPVDHPLRDIVPGVGFGPAEVLRIRLALSELTVPVVLVLDDFQVITSNVVLESFDQLLEHQPPRLRVLLVTRADPVLRLHRLRVSGDLTEIRAGDLAFTEPETAEMFDRNGFAVSPRQLGVLRARTQGWPAGLRLAMMSLEATDIEEGISRFSGTDGSVAEYLIGEVLDRLPGGDREFLLKTSVAEHLTGDLANELTGGTDGRLILEKLVGANAFVVAFGERNEWFGYHPLFREMLIHRLTLEHPAAVPELHLRAGRWFAADGDLIEGIRHATRAGNWDEVGRMMITASPLLLTVDGAALVAALGPAAARATAHPGWATLLAAAVCHYQRRDFDMMRLDAREAGEFLTGAPPQVRDGAEILIATVQMASARTRRAATLAQRSAHLLDLLDRAPRRHVPAGRLYRVAATNNLAVGQLWAGDLAAAATTLSTTEGHAQQLGLELAAINSLAHLALLDLIHGRLRDAHRRASSAQQSLDRRGWGSELQAPPVYLTLGLVHLDRNEPADAAVQIGRGLAASTGGSDQACRLALGIAAVRVAGATGGGTALAAAATRLRIECAAAGELPDMLARWCAVTQAEAHLALDEPAAAVECIHPAAHRRGFGGAQENVTLARAHLALGQPQTALDELEPVLDPALPYRTQAVWAQILRAVAAGRLHRTAAALEAITTAVDIAQPEGLTLPFISTGKAIAEVIVQHRHVTARHLDFTAEILAAINPRVAEKPPTPGDYEHLTDRELLVFRYLPTMLKSVEIAADLYLSVNTVKSHLRSIYRKLDVTTRRGAVDRGRAMNII